MTSPRRFDTGNSIFWDVDSPVSPVTVSGQPGKLIVGKFSKDSGSVTWLRKPGQWVLVQVRHDRAVRATLLRVAEGLRDQQQIGKPSFTVPRAQAGSVLLSVDSHSAQIWLPADPASTVTISVTNPISDNDIGDDTVDAKRVTVGKLSGWLQKKDGKLRLTLEVSDSIWMSVHAADADPWNEERLLRFAEGVEYIGPRPLPDP